MALKIDFIKKCAPKLEFFNKKIEKDSDDFWHRKFESPIWHFLTAQNSKFNNLLWVHWFLAKIFLIFYFLFENSTTPIDIVSKYTSFVVIIVLYVHHILHIKYVLTTQKTYYVTFTTLNQQDVF